MRITTDDTNIKQDKVTSVDGILKIETTPSVYNSITRSIRTGDKENYNTTKYYNENGLITTIFIHNQETWEYRDNLDSVIEITYDDKNNIIEKLYTYNYHGFNNIESIKTVWIYDDFNNVIEEKETHGSIVTRLKTYSYTYDKYNNWTKILISDESFEYNKKIMNVNNQMIIDRTIKYYFKNDESESTYSF